MKRVLAMCLVVLLVVGCMSIGEAKASSYGTVKGGWLKLRAAASKSAAVLDSYYTGTQVEILGSYGEWYYVYTSNGKYGYMLGEFLSVNGGGSSALSGTMYVTSENGKGVKLRTGPDTSYHVIGTYDVGTKVTVISAGSQWHYVKINGTYGYMMAKFLTSSKPVLPSIPSKPVSSTVSVVSKNGKSVNLRLGAGKGYAVIGSYSVGTKVSVLGFGREWCQVQVNGRTGYMMTEFLSGLSAKVHSSNGGAVAMRSGAGKSYTKLTSWPVGTAVTVLQYGSEWSYIRVNGWTGYMMTKFLVF